MFFNVCCLNSDRSYVLQKKILNYLLATVDFLLIAYALFSILQDGHCTISRSATPSHSNGKYWYKLYSGGINSKEKNTNRKTSQDSPPKGSSLLELTGGICEPPSCFLSDIQIPYETSCPSPY